MEIEIPLGGSRWPASCPCCGGRADGRLELRRSRGMFLVVAAVETVVKLEVPYCKACVSHARAYQRGTFGRLIYPTAFVLAGAFFAGMIGLAVTGGGAGSFDEMFLLLKMPAVVTVLFVVARVALRIRAGVGSPHVSTAPVLWITSWTNASIQLGCANESYAVAVQEANRGAHQFYRTG
jgi:hypothetical protein